VSERERRERSSFSGEARSERSAVSEQERREEREAVVDTPKKRGLTANSWLGPCERGIDG
jgi:hypothetical protein